MPASHSLDRVGVTFDDTHAVADAGLILPAALAQHLGLRDLFDTHVDLGGAPGHANVGHKAMTVIHSALADGDSIDDANSLRSGDTGAILGHAVVAPSTLGTYLRSFTWGHARQLDVVSGEILCRAWAAGAGPRSGEAVTVDVDSSIVETYGVAKQGVVRQHEGTTSPPATWDRVRGALSVDGTMMAARDERDHAHSAGHRTLH